MSREIKFRAWDKKQKKMLYGVSIGTIKVWDENAPFISHEFSYSEDCIFEQYTGLKDKNGKEIYEGDILEDDYDQAVGMVKYGIHNCGCCHSVYGFSTVDQNGEIVNMRLVGAEVVGNIHDNPELLKGEE